MGSPKEKAHGHDRYIGLFFSTCWEIVKGDIISAIQRFYNMNQQGLSFLNQAFVVLIPKKNNPTRITDYRPISLTHSFAKVISKLLANRLGPELDHLIFINQTAFIKDRCIHDNFIYVQEALKVLHKKKIPGLFIKLDISKAFDSVNWAYLLQIMKFIGFSQRWMNWISALWGTTSSVFLLNGEPDKRILHYRGVG
jgi:retron-type reverse transcriptase